MNNFRRRDFLGKETIVTRFLAGCPESPSSKILSIWASRCSFFSELFIDFREKVQKLTAGILNAGNKNGWLHVHDSVGQLLTNDVNVERYKILHYLVVNSYFLSDYTSLNSYMISNVLNLAGTQQRCQNFLKC